MPRPHKVYGLFQRVHADNLRFQRGPQAILHAFERNAFEQRDRALQGFVAWRVHAGGGVRGAL